MMRCLKDRTISNLINFGFGIFIYAATQVFMTFNQYMFLDYFGNTSLSGVSSIIMFAGIMLSAPFASALSKKIGMKETCVIGLVLSTISYFVLLLFVLVIQQYILQVLLFLSLDLGLYL